MRHRVVTKKLGRDTAHRKALKKNLAVDLIKHGSIVTSVVKAKYVRPYVENLVTKTNTKSDKLSLLGYLRSHLSDEEAIKILMEDIAPRYKNRNGGYTRIVRVGNRLGDNSSMARISFLEEK
ncbi:50S ribosomal protein L17 [Patescibacteria group bacterium]|nr:50S ribosomal protein L17 [Patescibacteria group bacterium]